MFKLKPSLEWKVGEEFNAAETMWSPQTTDHQLPQRCRKAQRLRVLAAGVILLAAFMGVARLVHRAELNIAQVEREIELAMEAESLMQHTARSRRVERVHTAPPAVMVFTDIPSRAQQWLDDDSGDARSIASQFQLITKPRNQTIELRNDLALVQVLVDDAGVPGSVSTVRETWFYRQTEQGWVRIAPDEVLWGPYYHHETSHFLFQYHQLDRNAVKTVASDIDTFYNRLSRDVGIDPLGNTELTIRIATNAGVQQIDPFYLGSSNSEIIVFSPRLLRVPTMLSDADALRQSIHAILAFRIIRTAIRYYKPQAAWQPVVDGLRQWAYLAHNDLHSEQAGEWNALLRQQLAVEAPPRLPVLAISPSLLSSPEGQQLVGWKQHVLVKTVIDYAVVTYGRASLSRLLNGLHEYDSRQKLIPAVFGVSVDEFERGWQDYLAVQYGLSY